MRLLSGKTNIAQLTTELNVTEADLMSWVNEVLVSRDERIDELTSLLKSYHRAAGSLIGIAEATAELNDENMVEGQFERRMPESPNLAD